MTFEELIDIRIQTCDARNRLAALREADLITSSDYVKSCNAFHETWQVVKAYMDAHGI